MRDLFPEDWKPNIKRFLLGLDAWVDFSVFRSASALRETYERFSTFMDRFHVSGWRRGLNEIVSEGATIGTLGMIVMLALAIPAFRETSDDDWLKKSELAVTFLDRYGNEVGSRGIKHNDAIPLDQFPDHLIKAVLSTEDRRFYEHFGIDLAGTARAGGEYPCRRRRAGRLLDHPAAREKSVPEQRAHDRAQGERGVSRHVA